MKSDNVIKKKRLHVGEDFYDELINGLQKSQLEESKVEEKDNSKILTPKQRLFLQKYTAPIILEEANKQGFLRDVMQRYYDKEKYKKEALLKFAFDQSMLQYGELSKEVDEISEEGSGWKGFDFLKGSSQIWKVINVARYGLELYNDYKKFKDKFKEKNLFLEDQKRFKIDEFSAINGGPQGVVNKVASRLDQSVELYSRPLGFVMDKVGRSVILGVDGLYEFINSSIYKFLRRWAAEEIGWAILGFIGAVLAGAGAGAAAGAPIAGVGAIPGAIGGAVAGGAGFFTIRAAAIAAKAKRLFDAISIIGNVTKWGYRVGRATKGTLNGRRVIRFIDKIGDSKVGSAALKVGGFVAKHPVGVKRLWSAGKIGIGVYDLYNVDSEEVRRMERNLKESLDKYGSSVKHEFMKLSHEIKTIDKIGEQAMKKFTSGGRIMWDSYRKKSEESDYRISKKYEREITIRGLKEIKIIHSFQKLADFFNNWNRFNFTVFSLPADDNKLSIPNKKLELSIRDKSFIAEIEGKPYFVDVGGNNEFKRYRDVVYGSIKLGEREISTRFYYDKHVRRRNEKSFIKLKQENYIRKIYNGSSLELIELMFNDFPIDKQYTKILYFQDEVQESKISDKIINLNDKEGVISIKMSDYIKQPNVQGYNKIYSSKDRELQEEMRFTEITEKVVKELESKLFYIDRESEINKIQSIIQRKGEVLNDKTKSILYKMTDEEIFRERIKIENQIRYRDE